MENGIIFGIWYLLFIYVWWLTDAEITTDIDKFRPVSGWLNFPIYNDGKASFPIVTLLGIATPKILPKTEKVLIINLTVMFVKGFSITIFDNVFKM